MTFPNDLLPFMLILFLTSLRFLGLLSSLIFFSETSIPIPVKFWLSLVLALSSLSALENVQIDITVILTTTGFLLCSAKEIFLGVLLGILASSPLYALHMAGRFISQQMGFAMAEILDPFSEQKVAVIGQMKYLLGTWFWFYMGGHLLMIKAVVESLILIPIGSPVISFFTLEGITAWISGLFVLAIKVILPYFGVLLLTEIGLGFMARMVPQMNIFMLGFPIKILLALILLSLMAVAMVKQLLPQGIEIFLEMFPLFSGG